MFQKLLKVGFNLWTIVYEARNICMTKGLRTVQSLDYMTMLFKEKIFLNSSETLHCFRSIYSVDTSVHKVKTSGLL